MSNILVTADGKKIKATESLDDLIQVGVEALDENRAGVIDNSTLKARASGISSIVSVVRTSIIYKQLTGDGKKIFLPFAESTKRLKEN